MLTEANVTSADVCDALEVLTAELKTLAATDPRHAALERIIDALGDADRIVII